MELHKIETLIDKYLEANTSLAEEETLKQYFTQDNIPVHLRQYASMFHYFSMASEEKLAKPFILNQHTDAVRKNYFKWAVGAAAVLLFGMYFGKSDIAGEIKMLEDEFTPEEIAQAQGAFELLAFNFNKGVQEITRLTEFEKNANKFLIKEEKR